ncbi:MAG: hypothetical protein ACK2UW_04220 [Anaerolineales bacterium]|jgi:hypothetical protein
MMRTKTVRIIFLLFSLIFLISLTGILFLTPGALTSIRTLAQSITQEAFFPLIQRDSATQQPPAQRTPIAAEQTSPPPQNQYAYIDGYEVPARVAAFYDETGADVAGRPLGPYEYDEKTNRYEMLFENIGIYIGADDPQQTIHMLPLGLMFAFSQREANTESELIPISPAIVLLLNQMSTRLGTEFTGKVLIPLTLDDAGRPTRIFENMVMKVDPQSPNQIIWEPLPITLGIPAQPAVPRINDPRFTFVTTQESEGLGHNIPLEFWEYIRDHADLAITGQPITEIFYPETNHNLVRQCFEHMCLDYNMATDEIRLTSLGIDYYRRVHEPGQMGPISPSTLALNIWEAQPAIPPDEAQVIFARISQNKLPIINVQPVLELTMPDDTRQTMQMSASDIDGISSLQLPPIAADNGTIIPYQVCVLFSDGSQFCLADQFLIWNAP